jgi:CDP-glucose 4,6-dehydratase
MAAQSLVRASYADPVNTFSTNIMGTVNLLEAVRQMPSVVAVLVVTSDKCYEGADQPVGRRETDPLGGHDPYSSSKGCAELVTDAYRRSFFASGRGTTQIASARAGNVIGGGDWAVDRLVPDAMRAFAAGQVLRIRNPAAVRPWQHVLDPIFGYLRLCERLSRHAGRYAAAWNFGPSAAGAVSVSSVVDDLARRWGGGARWEQDRADHPHEMASLMLDCSKAATELGWQSRISLDQALDLTVSWYRAFARDQDARTLCLEQIHRVLDQVGGGAPKGGGIGSAVVDGEAAS